MSSKKSNKKRASAPIKTREQKFAEERARKEAAKKRTMRILTVVLAVVLLAAIALTTVLSVRNSEDKNNPGFKKNGKIKNTVYVKMSVKDCGDIILELDSKSAPITVANFVKLVNEGFYDGLTFHRVIDDFMIQGGDPNGDGTGGAPNKIFGEFEENGFHNHIKHERGVISMARGNDNDSASSQFFICNSSSQSVTALNDKYAAFGHVISGLEVVDIITSKSIPYEVGTNGAIEKEHQVVITEVKVISAREARG